MTKTYILTLLSLLLTLFSCTAPIDIETRNSDPVLVVFGCITDENKNQQVRITSSSPYFDGNTSFAITDAKVRVISSDGHDYTFLYGEDGYYASQEKFAALPGMTYHLSVEANINKNLPPEVYEAQTTILPIVPVDSIVIAPLAIMGFRHFALNFYMQEPAETANYYLFKFFLKDTITNEKISQLIISDDRMYNGNYIPGATITYFNDATDEKILDMYKQYYEDDDDAYNYLVAPGDSIRLQVMNIEKGYYQFIRECTSEMYGENPFFGGPPSNITTNISNGAVGFFTGYCTKELTTVVP